MLINLVKLVIISERTTDGTKDQDYYTRTNERRNDRVEG